jgi:pilus assembly protein CpaE
VGSVSVRTVPNSYKDVNTAINQGNALVDIARSNAVTKTLAEFALSLSPKQEESRSLLGRLFGRA